MSKIKQKRKTIIIILSIILLILIDQIIKILIVKKLGDNGSINIIPNLLSLTYVKNTGGAFGVGQGNIVMFIITNFIVLGIIIKFMVSQKEQIDAKTNLMLILILSGGFSNLIDRLIKGYVVDYIDISQILNFPKFNLADIFIVCGWIFLVAFVAAYTAKEIKQRKKG